jgi:hypothetical protein
LEEFYEQIFTTNLKVAGTTIWIMTEINVEELKDLITYFTRHTYRTNNTDLKVIIFQVHCYVCKYKLNIILPKLMKRIPL